MRHDPGSHNMRMRVLVGTKELPGVWPRIAHGGRIHTEHLIREGVSSDDLLPTVITWKVRHTASEDRVLGMWKARTLFLAMSRSMT